MGEIVDVTVRRPLLTALVFLALTAPTAWAGEPGDPDASAPPEATGQEERLPPLKLEVDRAKVDLEAHRFELKMSRAAKKVRLRVLDAEGGVIAQEEIAFDGEAPGTPLTITWTPKKDAPVARVEVWGHDTFGYYAGVAIIPWAIRIPHEEVLFDTAKAVIKPTEESKLEGSYNAIAKAVAKHRSLGPIALFIAGHTDRVGSSASNLALSRRRARAIATWFKERGMSIPIAYEGFGEDVPAVKTGDNVDEPRNRRVDYILAIEPPRIKKSGAPAEWKKI